MTEDSAKQVNDGLLIVDKPAGWTSHDVVARTRRLAGTRRVGHAGTLDPMATGVLVLGLNRATKLLTFLVGCDKTYTATIRLGQATLTDDAEGEVTRTADVRDVDPAAVVTEIDRLTGPIEQVPSAVSAIKIKGVRSYTRAREGEDVDLPARPVTVHRFDLLAERWIDLEGLRVLDLDVEVEVSSGTYVRALARDLGAALGVGGHLTALRRTSVGRFGIEEAHSLDALIEQVDAGVPLPVIPMAQAARNQMDVREVSESEAVDLRHGKRLPAGTAHRDVVAAVSGEDLVAILDESDRLARSHVVFPVAEPT
ncbi:tRNA pseudouridine(55) synthase TruB [Luteipulveratus mongoliensis]|uniref:tRNA pseudouridine synthase B n=1 Tax=Luteipulveratus mongoliensis TaxID=571913 RepID=A0A0K1JIS9_9MICO|nr:tRNA pseudouridine(55) synthase TruB [Luteipulveratus mongoliensis]AKU16488.1 tRNA pseudouridine synthase B [Luteipulveratus mongoliensis]